MKNDAFAALFAALILCACNGDNASLRRGLPPILDAPAVEVATGNKIRIMTALAKDAGYSPSSVSNYYDVAQAGFNFVDDQCRSYFNELYLLDRDVKTRKSAISAVSQTTSAILGITGAPALTISIVAQAFGLANNATDIAGNSFLYSLPPATTKGFVRSLHIAYRNAVASRRTNMTSVEAYYHIQSYLDLCLPSTIEARLTEYVGKAQAYSDNANANPGAFFDLSVSSSASEIQVVNDGRTKLQEVKPIRKPGSNKIGEIEIAMQDSEIRAFQKMLCVKIDGDLGPIGSQTRKAVMAYLRTIDPARLPQDNPERIEYWGRSKLHDLVDSKKQACQTN